MSREVKRVIVKDPYRWSKLWEQVTVGLRRHLRHGIFDAIERADDKCALRLATKRVLQKSVDEFNHSPLFVTIVRRRNELALEFIARGGMCPGDGTLAAAAMIGSADLVEILLKAGKHPDEPLAGDFSLQNYTPLMWAVNRKYLAVLKLLLQAGANIDAVANDGTTAAMLTVDADSASLEALELLCAHGPDIRQKDWRGRNLIREALDREKNSGKPEMRKILERYFPSIDFDAE